VLPSQAQRRFYLQAARRAGWTIRELKSAIAEDLFGSVTGRPLAVAPGDDPFDGRPLRAGFGELYTYTTRASRDPESNDLLLDLGFYIGVRTDLSGIRTPSPGMTVRATTTRHGVTFATVPSRTRRFTYRAWVERIVDGDTLIATADLGLGHQIGPLRLRLRGIDCPELNTVAGRRARDFVVEQLAHVDFIVIATHRTDNYGRYLVDIRYMPGQDDPQVVRGQGTYLNRELLQERLARRY
jgi:endonuclease YncB( thermonuclease family)